MIIIKIYKCSIYGNNEKIKLNFNAFFVAVLFVCKAAIIHGDMMADIGISIISTHSAFPVLLTKL